MQEHESGTADETSLFAKLMKKLTRRNTTVLSDSERKVIRPHPESKSIVDVTEEVLRQTKK